MATKTRNPTNDVSFTGTWTAAPRWSAVDDHPDSGNPITDGITHGTTTAGEGLCGFAVFDVPAGSTAISVQVLYYCFKNASQACNIKARIRCNDVTGRDWSGTAHNPGNGNANIALFTDDYGATNPKSGAAWTVNDVNGVGTNGLTAFGVVSTDASPSITISSIQLQVTYTPPGTVYNESVSLGSTSGFDSTPSNGINGAIGFAVAAGFSEAADMIMGSVLGFSGAAGFSFNIAVTMNAGLSVGVVAAMSEAGGNEFADGFALLAVASESVAGATEISKVVSLGSTAGLTESANQTMLSILTFGSNSATQMIVNEIIPVSVSLGSHPAAVFDGTVTGGAGNYTESVNLQSTSAIVLLGTVNNQAAMLLVCSSSVNIAASANLLSAFSLAVTAAASFDLPPMQIIADPVHLKRGRSGDSRIHLRET